MINHKSHATTSPEGPLRDPACSDRGRSSPPLCGLALPCPAATGRAHPRRRCRRALDGESDRRADPTGPDPAHRAYDLVVGSARHRPARRGVRRGLAGGAALLAAGPVRSGGGWRGGAACDGRGSPVRARGSPSLVRGNQGLAPPGRSYLRSRASSEGEPMIPLLCGGPGLGARACVGPKPARAERFR